MCGRYVISLSKDSVAELTGVRPTVDPEVHWNRPPGGEVLLLLRDSDGNALLGEAVWGLHSGNGTGRGHFVINARSETADEKYLFRQAFAARRCCFLASGFFEWKRREEGSQPYYFAPLSGPGFLFGGLVVQMNGRTGAVILTREADSWMAGIHHRMPVLVRPGSTASWLNPSIPGGTAIRDHCYPQSEGVMVRHPVSQRVNRVDQNDASLVEPAALLPFPEQTELFGD